MSNTILKIQNLNLNAGNQALFKNFSLEVTQGEIVGFFAPTGSGKTSLFNYIATTAVVEPVETTISYVFQEPRLIPSQTVLKDVMLPLENKMDKATAKEIAIAWLEKLNMLHKQNDLAKTLSGGEQQRTSIARAFAYTTAVPEKITAVPEALEGQYKNTLLLLDEPFASQDEANIKNIINLIKQIIAQTDSACLVISHDLNILQSFCTRIITQKDFCVEK